MGAGGRSMPRAPASKPPFTLGELKKAIPPHCFQRSAIRSMSYVVQDLILVSFFYYIATNYFHLLPHPLSYLAWPLYWISTGSVLMGIWVIAHECGHHAFSNYPLLNDTVGLILHSALLTPYFSWKLSHRRHHSNTSSLEKDEVFVPKFFSQNGSWIANFIDDSPLLRIIIRMTIGWPLYLWFNLSGRKYDGYVSHFYPYSPVFLNHERVLIFITDLGVLAMAIGLYFLAAAKGIAFVINVYGVPLAIVNGFLVTITYLHHTHASIPHYDSSEWDWLRGALATIDRDFGILNHVLHHINDTHVVHHLFPIVPHYHATEATNAIKPVLGNYYQFDGTSLPMAVWREAKECLYIEKDEDEKSKGVFWYTSKAN